MFVIGENRVKFQFLSVLLALVFLSACGTSRSALRDKARDHFLRGEFAAAETETLNPEVIGESKNRLLTLLELGAIAHYSGTFEKSNEYLFRAKKLARRLYTTSIREQIATGLLNDNAASYVGMDYEISMMHYYIALNFLFLSQSETIPAWNMHELKDGDTVVFPAKAVAARTLSQREQVDFLGKSRSELLDWNAFLQTVRNSNRGQPYFKDDLLNKVVAAYIHRTIGNSRDRNIANVLYKDAEKILVKAYSAYPTFNQKSENYVENYKRFSRLGVKTVRERFIAKTPHYERTAAMIDDGQKKLRSSKNSIYYILEFGAIPPRQEKRFVIGLSTLFKNIEDPGLRRSLEELSTRLIIQLAPEFGLTVVGAAVVGAAVGSRDGSPQYISDAVDSVIGFEFYLPEVPADPTRYQFELKFTNTKTNTDTIIPVGLMMPLNDIARLNVERRAAAVAFKTGVRVGLKYLAALIPAIYTYNKVDGGEFIKMLAASAVWAGGKKIVDSSEAADIRAWNLLPKWVGGVEAQLEPGSYTVTAIATEGANRKETALGSIQVDGKRARKVFKGRILSADNLESSPTVNIIN